MNKILIRYKNTIMPYVNYHNCHIIMILQSMAYLGQGSTVPQGHHKAFEILFPMTLK